MDEFTKDSEWAGTFLNGRLLCPHCKEAAFKSYEKWMIHKEQCGKIYKG